MDPANFDEMRRGCWDIHARIDDMDLAGDRGVGVLPVADRRIRRNGLLAVVDPELGRACVEAWNDWHHEVWAGTFPGRIIPTQITWLQDPEIAAGRCATTRVGASGP